MRLALVALLAFALLAPGASALDAFPAGTRLGELEARFLLRLPEGGALAVESSAPVRVALVTPGAETGGLVPAPATLAALADSRWRGLEGMHELVVVRSDARTAVALLVSDGSQAGLALDWPAAPAKPVPAPGAPFAVAALALAGALQPGLRRRRMPLRRRPSRRIVSVRLPMWLLTIRTLPWKRSVICSGFAPKR